MIRRIVVGLDGLPHAIIAYDGSIQSARALRAFVDRFQDRLDEIALTLLTAGEKGAAAENVQKEALDYLDSWHPTADTVVSDARAHKVILEKAGSLADPLVVMGAYGKGGLSDLFFGSNARHLIDDSTVPIFFHQ